MTICKTCKKDIGDRPMHVCWGKPPTTLKLWKGNRKDGEWSLSYEEIADRFMKSKYADKEMIDYVGLPMSMVCFISEPEGLGSVWEFDKNGGSLPPLEPIIKIVKKKLGW